MTFLKRTALLLVILLYIACGIIVDFLTFAKKPTRLTARLTQVVSLLLRKILGLKISLAGNTACLGSKGNFVVCNHVSYLDGLIIASLFPAVFVSKSAVRSWPLFGWMARVGGTVFIDRQAKLRSADSVSQISALLNRKLNILLFPEGTSTNGANILSFQSVFFQSPIDSGSPVIPVTIQYTKIGSSQVTALNRDRVCWYGQISFFKHLLSVTLLDRLEARVFIHDMVEGCGNGHPVNRKDLSEHIRGIIAGAYLPVL